MHDTSQVINSSLKYVHMYVNTFPRAWLPRHPRTAIRFSTQGQSRELLLLEAVSWSPPASPSVRQANCIGPWRQAPTPCHRHVSVRASRHPVNTAKPMVKTTPRHRLLRIFRHPKSNIISSPLPVISVGQSELSESTQAPTRTAYCVIVSLAIAQWIFCHGLAGYRNAIHIIHPLCDVTTHIVKPSRIWWKLPHFGTYRCVV